MPEIYQNIGSKLRNKMVKLKKIAQNRHRLLVSAAVDIIK